MTDTENVIKKLRHFLHNHPEAVDAYVKALSKEAQEPGRKLMKLFTDEDHISIEKYAAESEKIRHGLSSEVVHELDDHRDNLFERARKFVCKVEVAQHIKDYVNHHPELAEKYVHSMSAAAQGPARELLKVFLDPKTTAECYLQASDKIRHGLPAEVVHELDDHRDTLMEKALELHKDKEIAKNIRNYVKAHPEKGEEYVKALSPAAQGPARELLKIFLDEHTTAESYMKESARVRSALPEAVQNELDVHRFELSAAAHELADTLEVVRKIKQYVREHPESAEGYVHSLSAAAQPAAKELIKTFLDPKTTPESYLEASKKIRAGLPANVVKELDEHRDHMLDEAKKLNNNVEIARKIKHYIKHHPEKAEEAVHSLSAAAQGPAKELLKIFLDDNTTPMSYIKAANKIKAGLPAAVVKELEEHREDMLAKAKDLIEHIETARVVKRYVKAHPEKAEAYIHSLSAAAQPAARELMKVFLDDFTTPECYVKALKKMHAEQPAAIAKELDEHREEVYQAAKKFIHEHREHKH